MGTGGHHKGLQLLLHQPLGQPLQLAVTEEAVTVNVAAGKQNQHQPAVSPAHGEMAVNSQLFHVKHIAPAPPAWVEGRKRTAGMSSRH